MHREHTLLCRDIERAKSKNKQTTWAYRLFVVNASERLESEIKLKQVLRSAKPILAPDFERRNCISNLVSWKCVNLFDSLFRSWEVLSQVVVRAWLWFYYLFYPRSFLIPPTRPMSTDFLVEMYLIVCREFSLFFWEWTEFIGKICLL